jgi:hypothetical protein
MPSHFDAIGIHDQDLGLSVLFSIHSNLACDTRGVVVGIFNGRELFAILVDMNVFTVDNGKIKSRRSAPAIKEQISHFVAGSERRLASLRALTRAVAGGHLQVA